MKPDDPGQSSGTCAERAGMPARAVLPRQGATQRLALTLAVTSLILAGCTAATPLPPRGPGAQGLETVLRATEPAGADLSYVSKIDSRLQRLIVAQLAGQSVAAAATSLGLTVDGDEVRADVYMSGSLAEGAAQLGQLGMAVLATSETSHVVEGRIPVDQILAVARLEQTRSVMAVVAYGTNPRP